MFSIKGTYENGKIKLLEPINIKKDTSVIITFLDHDIPFSMDSGTSVNAGRPGGDDPVEHEAHTEAYYEKLRQHKRYPATGNITIVGDSEEDQTYPLNDYSSGGLSFFSDRVFQVGEEITATLKYSAGEELLVMDFNMEVRGVFEADDGRYKIGCQFDDTIDEQLWHTIMG